MLRRARPDRPQDRPSIGCMPGSDVWFFRFAIAFVAHLDQGAVADRLRGRVVGNPGGRPFNFDHCGRAAALDARPRRRGHLFVGHAVCPGFSKIAASFPWWQDTRFCAPGFDYFGDGLDYTQVPVDMAPHAQARVDVAKLDAATWVKPAQRAVLVYPDPIEQAAGYFNYCRNSSGAQPQHGGRPAAEGLAVSRLPAPAGPAVLRQALHFVPGHGGAMPRAVSLVAESRCWRAPPRRWRRCSPT